MRKLFSLLCGIFVLYSATAINSSFALSGSSDISSLSNLANLSDLANLANLANVGYQDDAELECNLSRVSPSMLVATMEDKEYLDTSGAHFAVVIAAEKFGVFKYTNVTSCFVRTNIGDGDEEANTHTVKLPEVEVGESTVTFGGSSRFDANSSLGKFKIYCPLVAPNLERDNVTISISLAVYWFSTDKVVTFSQSSSNCRFNAYRGFAQKVEVKSNLSTADNLIIRFTNTHYVIPQDSTMYLGFRNVGYIPNLTLGTTGKYFFKNGVLKESCVIKYGIDSSHVVGNAIVSSSTQGDDLVIKFTETLESNQNYVIICNSLVSSIVKGNMYIPSVIFLEDNDTGRYSTAINTFY